MGEVSQPILRFAPSPNGYLHLGHAYSALFTAEMAQKLGGKLLLRIEDIDTARCRPEFSRAILEDLSWLGLEWEEPVRIQSRHFDEYRTAAKRLDSMRLLYPCFCTRTEIAAAAGEKTDPDGAPLYGGTCRHLSPVTRARRLESGEPFALRLDMSKALAVTGPLDWREMDPKTLEPKTVPAHPERWGDTIIARKDTPTSYHLSVVTDDAVQKVTHVTRGRDLYEATAIHRVLQTLLGLPAPLYCHHHLILDAEQKKLAKSEGAKSLLALREGGVSAAEIRRLLGLSAP
ncbi:MAG: tRNA glutamyl-Q(34) synthetase GluQRS [Cucumibacter sp.]